MEFRWSAEAEVVRAEAAALFDRILTPEVLAEVARTGTHDHPVVRRAVAAGGWAIAPWPVEDGGQAWDQLRVAPFYEEASRRGAPIEGYLNTLLVASALRTVGTDHQRRDVLPRLVGGEAVVALGISEPDSGSDAAAARFRAEHDGDRWRLDGQKMFTTFAEVAEYVLVLARTDSEARKHRGLTTFLVPTNSPGFSLQPVATMGGERTNITFFDGVDVADSARVGDVGGGWGVIGHVLAMERGVFPVVPGRCARLVELAVGWAAATPGTDGGSILEEPATRERLAWATIANEVGRLLALRTGAINAAGRVPVVEGSMAKLFSTEAMQDLVSDLADVVGPAALYSADHPGAVMGGAFEKALRHAPLETITGGTSEIQREIIATTGLGLPRSF